MDDLRKLEQDHQKTLVHLEEEKELRCKRLKAAQVKKEGKKAPVPLESKNSCEVGFTLQSSLIMKPVAAIYHVFLLFFPVRFLLALLFCSQDLHIAMVKRHDTVLGLISDLMKRSEDCRQASDQMETVTVSLQEVIKQLQ